MRFDVITKAGTLPHSELPPQSGIEVDVSARQIAVLYVQEQCVYYTVLLLLCISFAGGLLHVISDAFCSLAPTARF